MKRPHINEMMASFGFVLPPFAYWTPEELVSRKTEARNVIDARCGWDVSPTYTYATPEWALRSC
ncbi:D-lyxose/D-mannose family sugar isomerase [Ascidiaceihabitans sp.]|nr:D-lyxose/D-mannose family sugar isomerase [Ascidiaceihabitans sp.]